MMADHLLWIVDVERQTIEHSDGDTGVTLCVSVFDAHEHTWIWQAFDPDGEEFNRMHTPSYGPNDYQFPWDAIEAAESWYAGWLASDEGEDGEG